jgi:hypothetical protein
MPPCISKDREDLVAAAGSRLIQVRSYGHRAMHTPSGMALAHYHLLYLLATSCLAAGVCRENMWGNLHDLA